MPRRLRDGVKKTSGWQVEVHENGTKPSGPNWENEFSSLLHKLERPENVIKHDHRGEVGTFMAGGIRYVVKKFTFQSTRLWFRLVSVFFPTLGEIACRNGLGLVADGIQTPRPVLLMQQVKNGMVTSSWVVYRFMEGDVLSEDNAQEIVSFVKSMHQSGWVHRDPHPANFIRTSRGLATLDPIKVRQSTSPYLRAYDVVLMEHDMPDASELYGKTELQGWYRLAKLGHWFVRFYRALKSGLRRVLGIAVIHSVTSNKTF